MRKKILSLILFILSCLTYQSLLAQDQPRIIEADFQRIKGLRDSAFNQCVGAGRANEGLRADWQRQLTHIQKTCDFRYIRMHGLLHDDMGVYFEDKNGLPIYNFQYVDELFDFLLSIRIRPFVEFGFMPSALASNHQTVFWWKGNISPPKDYDKWSNLIKNLLIHWSQRYGEEEVKKWYFEVWNEPNLKDLFWSGDQNEYFKLYERTAKAVKSVCAGFRVGGPATAGSGWIPEFINFCYTHQTPVDFVSTHMYGVDQGFLDEKGDRGTILSKNEKSLYAEAIRSRKQIQDSKMPGLELHYTEWSSSYTPTDPIHDSYHEAAYILEKLRKTGNAVHSMSYWTFTDIFEEMGPRPNPFHGGFGLLNYQDIQKPAFYAFQFLHQLGKYELQNKDKASWICKDQKGNLQVLFWDFTNTHPGDSVNNQVYYKRDLPSREKGKVLMRFTNVPAGKYLLKIFQVGYRNNDAYTTYMDLGSPLQLSKDQVAAIKVKNNGSPKETRIVNISPDQQEYEFMIHENDVWFMTLERL